MRILHLVPYSIEVMPMELNKMSDNFIHDNLHITLYQVLLNADNA